MKNLRRVVFLNLLLALFVSAAALSAFADPPGRAVRLQYISGAVSIQPGGVNDWVEGVVNRPLTTSDRVWTDKEARAELHLGSAALRMNAETSLTLTNVSDDVVQIELDQGTLNLHIRHLFGGETYEIDTPNQAFTILKAGDYRFDVDPNADTTSVAVFRGEGEANGQGPGVKIKSGHQATFTGGTSMQYQMASAPGFDGFDDWCRVRDDREDHARSYQYVSADVVGASELDEYGTWRTVGEYGPVWVPTVAPGWAPYHYGHWVWVEPWGWTWVDDAPWGFAPSHYGRWVYTGGYWAWAPGPVVVARPVYAPALVAWVGGPQFGVSLSFGGGGGVGWFPLGWGEPYVPSYAVSRTYFQQVNVSNTHITNITNVTNNYYVSNNNTTVVNNNISNIRYANQNVRGAVTAVPTRTMTNAEPVAKSAVAVPASEIKPASFTTAAPVAPARTSVLGANANARAAVPPTQVTARPVVSHVAPPPKPVPFEAKQEVLAKNPGRPLDAGTEAELRKSIANRPQPAPAPAKAQSTQPTQPGKPGTRAASNPNAGEAKNAPHPENASRPANTASQPQPAAPARNVPRPPTATVHPVSANPATPTPMSRPVPRPPQPESANPHAPNGEAARPNMPASPRPPQPDSESRGAAPRPPQPETPNPHAPNGEAARPNMPSNPHPAQPDSGSKAAAPRPSNEVPHPASPPPAISARPANPRPPQNQPRPNMEQSAPRPSAPQHQSSPAPPPAHNNSGEKPSHQQPSKSEHKGEGR
jgi:FecR protein